MPRLSSFIRFAFVVIALLGASPNVSAAPMPQTPIPAQTKPFNLLPVAAEIGQQIQALVTGDANADVEPEETFGTRALGLILKFFQAAHDEGANFITNFTAMPQLVAWLAQQVTDPVLKERWLQIGQQLLLAVGGAFVAGWLADLALLPIRRGIIRRRPTTLFSRFGAIFAWFCLSLVPVILFIGGALTLIDQNEPSKVVRFFVMTFVYALALLRLIRLLIRFLLAPKVQNLRLIPVATPQAVYIQGWLSAFSFVMVFGFFAADLAQLVRVPASAITTFNSLIGLIVIGMTITVIAQKRAFVSTLIRGDLSAARQRLSLWQSLRLWFARSWHVLAILYLVIGYLVTTLRGGGGFAFMQRGTIFTLLILVAMRMAFYLTARVWPKNRHEGDVITSGIYRPVLKVILRLAAWVLAVAGVGAAWGVDVKGLFASPWGQRIMGSAFSITTTIVLVVIIYEIIHLAIERNLNRRDAEDRVIEANPRARTLLPMLRNAAIIILAVVVGIVTLSELGINIAPLLAGAGVLGVAVGFGSQTLVKDFLTGLSIILENTIAIGDVVTIAGHSGTVEGMSIRTVRLRDAQGALHILPFSEITQIINQTKGYSYALMDIGVAYDSDLKKVMKVMQKTGEKLQADPAYKPMIMEPIEVLGVETFGDSSITVRCRIKTEPGKQWEIKRAFMLLIKERFDAEKIEIPFPTVMQLQKT